MLGLIWILQKSVLRINEESLEILLEVDAIGLCCTVTLKPKLLLQEAWKEQIGWDSPLDMEGKHSFRDWVKKLHYLKHMEIPRWLRI